jgi:two-component system, OmpR family, sensor histidine kinase ChvG
MTTLPRLARVDAPLPRAGSVLDAVEPPDEEAAEASVRPARRLPGLFASSLARRIVLVNLALVAGLIVLALVANPYRQALTDQRQQALLTEARLVAGVVAGRLGTGRPGASEVSLALSDVRLAPHSVVFVFESGGGLLARASGPGSPADLSDPAAGGLSGYLSAMLRSADAGQFPAQSAGALARSLVGAAQGGLPATAQSRDPATGSTILAAAAPLWPGSGQTDVVVVTAPAGDLALAEGTLALRLLWLLAAAAVLSVALSLGLAASIAGPLSALASAAEQGRDRHARKMTRGRVRIPDLAERPDEIGRLSKAMRGMVAALYDRIDANEQFAADVAHEIKNPLASLRAAVGTLRGARRDDQRDRLLDVIEHDVRRLDRLVSDISNASRLDSDLVREESLRFNLLRTLANLGEHLGRQAAGAGVEFITDLPPEPILIDGLEGRLAQVFVNLVSNAISFCDEGDAVRLWARRRENRVLIVVEDTGPGIPESALGKVFDRFYSERPELDFGNHSGLGLAISKQIVEAHGGVIWAENIRPTHADITSEPLGARFVVGLPV